VVPVGGKKKLDPASVGMASAEKNKEKAAPAPVETQHYSIDYSFDGRDIRFLPQPNGTMRNSLVLMLTSFDRTGHLLSGVSSLGTGDLHSDAYQKAVSGQLSLHQEVDVPVEAAALRLGIHDQASNHLGTVDIPLPLPADPNAPHRSKNPLPPIEPD